ncbi:MAG: hypothetical protein V5A34_01005 [Halapricum sp.]
MVVFADLFAGLLIMLAGGVLIVGARSIADVTEKLDAIGSTHSAAETEAAWWKVSLFRVVAAFLVLLGLVIFLGSLLR